MQRYGIIDLGSNTIRLAIYDVSAPNKGKISSKDITELISTKKTVGLSSYVVDGKLTDDGIDKAADVLSELLERAKIVRCDKVRIFATAVIRNCSNSKAATRAIEKRIGADIDVISGEEEAYFDFVGATIDKQVKDATLVDIGGGSTELVAIADGKPTHMVSLDQGSVSSFSNSVENIFPTKKECRAIGKEFAKKLKGIPAEDAYKNDSILGVGGSMRAAAKMDAALKHKPKATKVLSKQDIEDMLALLEQDESTFAHAIAKAAPDRIHTIGCALVIISTIMDEIDAQSITICKHGVREGYLLSWVLNINI